MDEAALLQAITTEVEELHEVFAKWFAGDLDGLDRVAAVLGDTFTIVMPDGNVVTREPLLAGLNDARASRAVAIEIRNVAVRWWHHDAAIATYEEWQQEAEQVTGRLSTVVFSLEGTAPNGVRWQHVHETWLQPPPAAASG